uniref:Serine/threonine-protein kinase STN8, chloroplastic n=1 Tax=Vitis vinifera TaxID=29760 RepID=F6GXV9_VITVI
MPQIQNPEICRGWDLATKLISERGSLRSGRLSAALALRHPYFLLGGDQAAAVLSKLSLTLQMLASKSFEWRDKLHQGDLPPVALDKKRQMPSKNEIRLTKKAMRP